MLAPRTPSPRAFRSPEAFRVWLLKHHATEPELLIRIFKNHMARRGMTNAQAVDEALCFGWIDGVRRRIDADSFSVRFTPRRKGSVWSAINIRRVAELEQTGRMHEAGRAAFAARVASSYSYESRPRELAPALLARLKKNRPAWRFFSAQAPWYQRISAFWIMSAKQPQTRERRLADLIARSEEKLPIRGLAAASVKRPAAPAPGPRGRPGRGTRRTK
jgi:uncharacterized protein YdeI (YjbR/CyaY-like superfamily)